MSKKSTTPVSSEVLGADDEQPARLNQLLEHG